MSDIGPSWPFCFITVTSLKKTVFQGTIVKKLTAPVVKYLESLSAFDPSKTLKMNIVTISMLGGAHVCRDSIRTDEPVPV